MFDTNPSRRRKLLLVTWGAVVVGAMQIAFAQDAQKTVAPAAAQNAEAPAAASPTPQRSMLSWLVHTSGWIGALLLVISVYFVAKVVDLFFTLRPSVMLPEELIKQGDALLQQRNYSAVYTLMKESDTELGQLIVAGMHALSSGLTEAREAVDRVADAISVDLERRTSMLSVIGSLGPMIGLLGTLKGMISSFSVIAMSDTQLKPSEVAGGISEALVLTFEGVALSVPAIYFFSLFKGRVASLVVHLTSQTDDFLRRMQAGAQQKPASAKAEHT